MPVNSYVKTAVIGHPISHSKSPLIHTHWLKTYGLPGGYEAIDIHPDHLQSGIEHLIEHGYKGFNVTVPHKVSVMDLCDEIDDLARSIGAVNTVTIDDDGRLHGSNTDAFGFVQNIKEHAQDAGWDWSFDQGAALVLGAGGAAQAIVYALLQEGVPEVLLSNRTRGKAEDLARRMGTDKVSVVDWEARQAALSGAHLIVNTTTLGMTGSATLELDLTAASKQALVTDIVYAPLMTDLLGQAKAQDLKYVTGIGMLLHQARPGFERWNGVLPDVDTALQELVLS